MAAKKPSKPKKKSFADMIRDNLAAKDKAIDQVLQGSAPKFAKKKSPRYEGE